MGGPYVCIGDPPSATMVIRGLGVAKAEAIFIAQDDCHPEREVAIAAIEDETAAADDIAIQEQGKWWLC
jgi:hypothetical protein